MRRIKAVTGTVLVTALLVSCNRQFSLSKVYQLWKCTTLFRRRIMTTVKCRPVRTNAKPGQKTVLIPAHKRSKPAKLPKCK